MGRFRVFDNDENDHDGDLYVASSNQSWEFVANRGEECAIVKRRDRNDGNQIDSWRSKDRLAAAHWSADEDQQQQPRTIYFWSRDEPLDEDWVDVYREHERTRRTSRWFCFTWPFFLAILVAFASWWIREGPPGPPIIHTTTSTGQESSSGSHVQHTDWNDFLTSHGQQLLSSSKALFFAMPMHVFKWWALHVVQDVCDFIQHIQEHLNEKTVCIEVNTSLPADVVLRQARAVQAIQDALQAWQREAPLLLYLTGFVGTGKRTLAQRLYQDVYNTSLFPAGEVTGCRLPRLLHFRGKDYENNDRIGQYRYELQQRIHNHDGPILIENVQHMEPSLFAWLIRELGMDPEDLAASDSESSNRGVHMSLRQHCRRHVIMFTSTIGSRSIAKSLRQTDPSAFHLNLEYEINSHFGAETADMLDAIAPFSPLTRDDLKDIFKHQIAQYSQEHMGHQWKSFELGDRAIDFFLGPDQVEFLSWEQNRDGQTSTFSFSSYGASSLGEKGFAWKKIHALVKQCMLDSETELIARLNANGQELILSWCKDELEESSCQELCRHPIL